jgi:hypothetical protein
MSWERLYIGGNMLASCLGKWELALNADAGCSCALFNHCIECAQNRCDMPEMAAFVKKDDECVKKFVCSSRILFKRRKERSSVRTGKFSR